LLKARWACIPNAVAKPNDLGKVVAIPVHALVFHATLALGAVAVHLALRRLVTRLALTLAITAVLPRRAGVNAIPVDAALP
jgi:hypothetical protein